MSERLLTVAIILFVLSMVCERVANFLKLWLSDGHLFNNLRLREDTKDCEKQRELRIQGLSVFCGLLVAVGFGADFNYILGHAGDAIASANDKPSSAVSISLLGNYLWTPISGTRSAYWLELGSRFGGTLLVGVFISFGSKFWHDLVDLLLETKNLRGKLADQATFQVESMKQLDDYLQLREGDMVEAVFREQGPTLRTLPGVLGVGLSSTEEGGRWVPCIMVVLAPGTNPAVVSNLHYDLGGGRAKPILVRTREGSVASIRRGIQLGPGSSIGNLEAIARGPEGAEPYGSLCFPVYRQSDSNYLTPLLLTCYHVLRYGYKPGAHQWENFVSSDQRYDEVRLNGTQGPIARLVEGLRTAELDVALAEVLPGAELVQLFKGLDWKVKGPRWLNSDDPHRTRVRMLGGVSGEQWGTVAERDMSIPINYHDDNPFFLMTGLLTVATMQGLPLSKPGDSGSLLLDDQGYAVGLVVAADTTHTYAIPFQRILNSLHLMLKP